MSFWGHYRGRCIGRAIHFLYHYAGFDVAEHAEIGHDAVTYRGKPFARFTWSDRFGRCDVPEFTFLDDKDDRLALAQTLKVESAIRDGCTQEVPQDGRAPVAAEALRVINRYAYNSATLAFQIIHGVWPEFFVHGDRLFAEGNGWIYSWLHEANGWALWVKGEERQAESTQAEARQ